MIAANPQSITDDCFRSFRRSYKLSVFLLTSACGDTNGNFIDYLSYEYDDYNKYQYLFVLIYVNEMKMIDLYIARLRSPLDFQVL